MRSLDRRATQRPSGEISRRWIGRGRCVSGKRPPLSNTADRHRTDLRTIPNPGSYTLYEFESSRLTNRHTHGVVKTEGLIWGYNKTCSFGLMRFDTTLDDPQVRFELIDIDGNRREEHTLRRSELAPPGN